MLRRFHWLPLLLVAFGFIAALAALTLRFRAEARSRAVAMVVDYGQVRTLATAAGMPLEQALHDLQAAGVTGVAVTEETLGDLQSDGVLDVEVTGTPAGREYRLEIADPVTADRVAEYLPRFVPGATRTPPAGDRVVIAPPLGSLPSGHPGNRPIYLPGRFEDLRQTPTGLDRGTLDQIREAGLEPVGRIQNPLGLTPETLDWRLAQLDELGVGVLIFAGEEVLGYRELIPLTAEGFRKYGLVYGSVEFGKQRGDEQLARRLEDRLVRVHSISGAEMARLSPREAVERYVRAAEERNIRLLYVRLPAAVTRRTYPDNVAYVRSLARELVRADFGIGAPVPFERVWPSESRHRAALAAIALGIGAGVALLAAGLLPMSRGRQAALGLGAAMAASLLAFTGAGLAQQFLALLAAIVFPTLAFVVFPQPVGAFEAHEHAVLPDRSESVVPAVAEFAAISVVSLTGALMGAALLSELPYMVKTRAFAGIKLAHVAPLLLVAWIYLTGMTGEYPSWETERKAIVERLRGFFSEPVRVWHSVVLLFGLAALVLLLARTGNEAGVGVSELELRFRALLDRVLGVRPRTKEFAIGHPALLLSLAMIAFPSWRKAALPLLLIGIVGQVSMVNSFAHLHTPIKLTVLRTINGLWTGGLIGLLLIGAWLLLTRPGGPLPERARRSRAPG